MRLVQLLGLKEGSLGAFGAPQSATDITKLITKDYRAAGLPAASDERGMLVDPVCGMTVPPEDAEITLVHEGTTYGFCAAVCKKVFVEEHALSA